MPSLHSGLAAQTNAKEALLYPQKFHSLFFILINFIYLKERYIKLDVLSNIYVCFFIFYF
ncbi:hypothetical protein HMPREF0454_03993 [Hafnia alvei ATCC 51873]|uniref:Uncharacterized protein n=1 Tax=Hafnia alvei ATCC 51873 TaxID=1002364 RepID=G9YBV0_HAFAL|nr:hypothetical protein HMPREF0454_03993 [Hafnia alvei ATCC 51873]